ncbi:unnamed protein product [Sphagnum troendelagicum]
MLRFLFSSVGSWLIFVVKMPGSILLPRKNDHHDSQRFLERSSEGEAVADEQQQQGSSRSSPVDAVAKLDSTLSELDRANAVIETLRTELHESRIAQRNLEKNLEGKVSELKRLADRLQAQNTEHNGRFSQLYQEAENVRRRNKGLEQRNRKLEEDIKSLEQEKAKSYIGGESFRDSGPTPHLLVGAVEGVQQAVSGFTKLFVDSLRKLDVDCDLMARNLVPPNVLMDVTTTAGRKFVFQSFICHVMFSEFENECFGVQAFQSRTLDHEQYRNESFGQYQGLRNVEDPGKLVYAPASDSFFRSFCFHKYETLTRELRSYMNTPESDANLAAIRSKMEQKFLKLAQCVWLIHRLAFSFDPMARIFRVLPGMSFDEMYMHSVVMGGHGYEEDDDAGMHTEEVVVPTVGLMVVPGFFVRRIIVRSSVYLVTKPSLSSSSMSSNVPEHHQALTIASENNTTKEDPEALATTDPRGFTE